MAGHGRSKIFKSDYNKMFDFVQGCRYLYLWNERTCMLTLLSAQQTFDHVLFELVSPLRFDQGFVYNLTGANGCGKTTLLELMAHIQRGETKMLLNGKALEYRDMQYCSSICYVSVHDPLPDILVKDYFIEQNCQVIPGMSHLLHHRIGRLSTGEKQLLKLLPITHAKKTDFIYLDEPFNGLDATKIEWARGVLKQHANDGAIVVYASHIKHETEVEVACDQCIQIHSL